MPHLASYVGLAVRTELDLVRSFLAVSESEKADPEIWHGARTCARLSVENVDALEPVLDRYETERLGSSDPDPDRFWSEPVVQPRTGPVGMVRDLQDLVMLAALSASTWTVVEQGAKAMRDKTLADACIAALGRNHQQSAWLTTQLKVVSPQVLLVVP